MTVTSVDAPGARLHVVDEGDPSAPPVLLLHAGIADLRSWDALVLRLTGAGFRAIRYDARGYGRTEAEDVPFSNRADALAVLDALGVERAALVGNSRGGVIAIDTAIERPDRAVAVVGVAAGLSGYVAEVTPDEEATMERMEALEERLETVTGPERARLVDEIVELDLAFWVDGPGQPEGRAGSTVREALRRMDLDHYMEGRIGGRPTPLEPRAVDRLTELTVPVLMVAGGLDVSETLVTADHVASVAPDASSVVIDGVAHMVGMEAPDRLAALIVEHLRPLGRWS